MTDTPLTPGQALAAQRWAKHIELTCEACGQLFQGHKGGRYCTRACRQRGWRKNHPGSRTQLKLRKMERDRNTTAT